jgi:hypothetical protein
MVLKLNRIYCTNNMMRTQYRELLDSIDVLYECTYTYLLNHPHIYRMPIFNNLLHLQPWCSWDIYSDWVKTHEWTFNKISRLGLIHERFQLCMIDIRKRQRKEKTMYVFPNITFRDVYHNNIYDRTMPSRTIYDRNISARKKYATCYKPIRTTHLLYLEEPMISKTIGYNTNRDPLCNGISNAISNKFSSFMKILTEKDTQEETFVYPSEDTDIFHIHS